MYRQSAEIIDNGLLAFMREEHDEGLSGRLLVIVVEECAGGTVHRADPSVRIDDHHAVGRGLENGAKLLDLHMKAGCLVGQARLVKLDDLGVLVLWRLSFVVLLRCGRSW